MEDNDNDELEVMVEMKVWDSNRGDEGGDGLDDESNCDGLETVMPRWKLEATKKKIEAMMMGRGQWRRWQRWGRRQQRGESCNVLRAGSWKY